MHNKEDTMLLIWDSMSKKDKETAFKIVKYFNFNYFKNFDFHIGLLPFVPIAEFEFALSNFRPIAVEGIFEEFDQVYVAVREYRSTQEGYLCEQKAHKKAHKFVDKTREHFHNLIYPSQLSIGLHAWVDKHQTPI